MASHVHGRRSFPARDAGKLRLFYCRGRGDASVVSYAPDFVRQGGKETGEKNSGHKVLRLCFFFAILYREKNLRKH